MDSQVAASLHVPVNRVVLHRPTAESVYGAGDVATGRQSADASRSTVTTATTGTTALAATKVNPSRDEIPTLSHLPTCSESNADFFVVQFDMDRFIADTKVTLHYVNLIVNDDNGTSVEVDSLFDSLTQLSVIREDVIESLQCDVLGEVKLLGLEISMSTGKVSSLNAIGALGRETRVR